MKTLKITVVFVVFINCCFSQQIQSTNNRYFSDQNLKKQVAENKAKFVQTVLEKSEGIRIIEVRNVKSNELISYESFKGEEPIGKWLEKCENGYDTLDYDFNLVYSQNECFDDSSVDVGDYFQDNESVGYKAPKIKGDVGLGLFQYLVKTMNYPNFAVEKGIQGNVLLQFSITKSGIDAIVVNRGVHKTIDKEAVRILRKIKFESAPVLKGLNVDFNCVFMPINFSLQ